MRVCVFTTSYPRFPQDGAGIFIAELVEQISQRGHAVSVIVPATLGAVHREKHQIRTHQFQYWPKVSQGRVGYGSGIIENLRHPVAVLQFPFFWIAANIAMIRWARKSDAIHIHWWLNAALVLPALMTIRKPVVITAHGSDVHQFLSKRFFRFLAALTFHRAQQVIAVSEGMQSPLTALSVSLQKLTVLPNGISNEQELLSISLQKKFSGNILTIGRLIELKNHEVLIRAFAQLTNEFPDASISIIGEGPLRRRLEAIISELQLTTRVRLLGQQSRQEVIRALTEADIFTLTSRFEGMPIVLLEAMAAGKAIVATEISGVTDVLRTEENALLVPSDDQESLTVALRRLLNDQQLRERLSATARTNAIAKYRWSSIAQRTEMVYQRAIQDRSKKNTGISIFQSEEDFTSKYTKANRLHQVLLDGYFRAVHHLIGLIPKSELHQAVEIGCGAGFSTERLLSLLPPGVHFEASEFLERLVIEARQRVPSVVVTQEDIYHLHRQNSSLDLTFALEVFEHLDNVSAGLAELRRVSRYAIIGVPNEPWWRILNTLRGKYLRSFGNTPGHINHWSGRSLKKLLTQSGFEVLASRSPLPWTLVLVKSR